MFHVYLREIGKETWHRISRQRAYFADRKSAQKAADKWAKQFPHIEYRVGDGHDG